MDTPYATAKSDGRAGGRVGLEFWPTGMWRLKGIAEAAQPSTVYANDLNTIVSARVLMEATF